MLLRVEEGRPHELLSVLDINVRLLVHSCCLSSVLEDLTTGCLLLIRNASTLRINMNIRQLVSSSQDVGVAIVSEERASFFEDNPLLNFRPLRLHVSERRLLLLRRALVLEVLHLSQETLLLQVVDQGAVAHVGFDPGLGEVGVALVGR